MSNPNKPDFQISGKNETLKKMPFKFVTKIKQLTSYAGTADEKSTQRAVKGRGRQRPPKPSDRFEGPFVATVDVYDDCREFQSLPANLVPGIIVEDVASKTSSDTESVHRATPANVSTRPISPAISAKINQYEKNLHRHAKG